jgi:hypothetical protein
LNIDALEIRDPIGHIAAVKDFDAAAVAALAGGNARKLLTL